MNAIKTTTVTRFASITAVLTLLATLGGSASAGSDYLDRNHSTGLTVFTRDDTTSRDDRFRPVSRSRYENTSRYDDRRNYDRYEDLRIRDRYITNPRSDRYESRTRDWRNELDDLSDRYRRPSDRYDNRDLARDRYEPVDDYRADDRYRPLPVQPHSATPSRRLPSYMIPTNYRPATEELRNRPDLSRFPNRNEDLDRLFQPVPQTRPVPQPVAKPQPTRQQEIDRQRLKISYRYSHPTVRQFINQMSADRGFTLYRECSQLIDTRHLSPQPYSVRVQQAFTNLMLAVERPEFASATGLRVDANRIRQYQHSMSALLQSRPVNNMNEAEQMMRSAMSVTNQHLGVNANVVILEFIYGSAESLDKYSAFEPKADQSAEIETETDYATLDEHIVGIGVELKLENNGVRIVKVLPGGPAERGGLRGGDIIRTLNGQATTGLSLDSVVSRIGGAEGTHLLVGISRDGQSNLVTLTRGKVKISTVSHFEMVDRVQGVGYLKLDKFGKGSSREVDEAMWKLHSQGMKSLIFDVRGNPGGLLTAAIEISNKFLPCGTIVSTRGRNASDNSSESADYGKTWKIPVIVLVDGDSASASEIFAAAIQDNKRGVVVGSKSYGKGTVQTHFPLRAMSGTLRLTTAKFYSPEGREMAGEGVTPDIEARSVSADATSISTDLVIARAIDAATSRQVHDLALAAARCRVNNLSRPTGN